MALNNQPPTESELEVQDREGMNTMFLVQRILVQGSSTREEALVFYDIGSNVSMIRDEMANKLGLKGRPVKQKLVRSAGMSWTGTPRHITFPSSRRMGAG